MSRTFSEFGGGPKKAPPKKAQTKGIQVVPTASRQLQAGYKNGTADITAPDDPMVFKGQDTEQFKKFKKDKEAKERNARPY